MPIFPRLSRLSMTVLLSLVFIPSPAQCQVLTGGVGMDQMNGGLMNSDLGQTTSGIVGPVGLPDDVASDGYLFQIPNFEGDTREQDLYYYMHPYAYQPWDTYRQELYQYAANARQQMSQGWPPPPYSVYDYAGNITPGVGGFVPPPAGDTPTTANPGSGVSVNPSNGTVSGAPSTAGENSGLGGTAITNVSGQLVQPPEVVPPPATMEPLKPIGQTPGWTGM